MRIGRGHTTLEFRFTEAEAAVLKGRAVFEIPANSSDDAWGQLVASPHGTKVSNTHSLDGHPYRMSIATATTINTLFGMQIVACMVYTDKIIFAKPDMTMPIRSVKPRGEAGSKRITVLTPPNRDEVRRAVGLINELKRAHGSAFEISINADGLLSVRMIMEF